jgi:hypothetical protein
MEWPGPVRHGFHAPDDSRSAGSCSAPCGSWRQGRCCGRCTSMDGWTVGRLDGWTVGRLDGWTVGRLDGWTEAS